MTNEKLLPLDTVTDQIVADATAYFIDVEPKDLEAGLASVVPELVARVRARCPAMDDLTAHCWAGQLAARIGQQVEETRSLWNSKPGGNA